MGNFLCEPDVAGGPPGDDGQLVIHSVQEADVLLSYALMRAARAAEQHMTDLENVPGLSDVDRYRLVHQAERLWDQIVELEIEIDHAHVELDGRGSSQLRNEDRNSVDGFAP